MNGFIKSVLKLIAAIAAGALGGILLLFVWIFVAKNVSAQEAIPTRPATLGEQNRSLSYQPQERTIIEVIIEADDNYVSILNCARYNRKRLAMLKMIAARIAERPEHGHLYKNAILSIRESWCD